jgi:hypothetical protein
MAARPLRKIPPVFTFRNRRATMTDLIGKIALITGDTIQAGGGSKL